MPSFTIEQLKQIEEMRKKQNEGLSPKEIKKRDEMREAKRKHNIDLLNQTLSICENGEYNVNGETYYLDISKEEMEAATVFLPEEIKFLPLSKVNENHTCFYSCENKDCLVLAKEIIDKYPTSEVLVLNLAGYKRPGGGSRDGGSGQEEDLVRRSTLLISLDSASSGRYYEYNNRLDSDLASDGVILSPNVVVFRNNKEELLTSPYHIGVISCAAPMVRFGYSGLSEKEYEDMLLNRIKGILKVASHYRYKHLILGAFGCGVYANDAHIVSDLFKKALSDESLNTFDSVSFAVLTNGEKSDYNFTEFYRNFGDK
ncbi:MAG: TIGR02452 family protein [Coprobacillus sp.]|nr:TIGR02452 family protein [Coprobacillus sp.]